MYRRVFSGIIDQGKTSAFLAALRESNGYQAERGIRARTTVWSSMTGRANAVQIASDFNTLDDLEKFTELTALDASFSSFRRAVRAQMQFAGAQVTILRLAYHSAGLITSEEATTPRKYLRMVTGDVQAGRHREFVMSVSQALEYQKQHGIEATTSVWTLVTGGTSGVAVVAEFDSLADLEKYDDLSVQDAAFGRLRKTARETMVFTTSETQLMRNLR